MSDFSALRVLVVGEWLLEWAGAERVFREIVRVMPHADIVLGAASPRLLASSEFAGRARETWLGRLPGARTTHRWLIPLQYPAFAAIDTRGYDLVISSSSGFGKAVRAPAGRPHVCYCHSPPRYLWDMASAYQSQENALMASALRLGKQPLRWLDRSSARGVTHFVANSRYVADRIRRAYGHDAQVIAPPVERKPVSDSPGTRGDFLLTLGRLVPYKRVDLAIDAAERLGIPLVVAGDGPDRPRLERRAGRHVTFTGPVDEATAGRLLGTCRAFLFCAEEDFGIAPIEANAHAAPVIGLRRGGLPETMTDRTAEFFDSQDVPSVTRAIGRALERRWVASELIENAARFAPDRFRREFSAAISAAIRPG